MAALPESLSRPMKSKIQLAGILLVIGLVVLLVIQNKSLTRIQTENARLREASQQLDQLRDENERLAKLSANTNELERLRKEHSELLRLRGEIGSLREKLKSAENQQKQSKPVARAEGIFSADSDPVAPPVKKYQAAVHATVPNGHSLATGGWEMQPGKRVLALATPTIGQDGQVEITTRFAEMPNEVFDALGFKDLKADGTESKIAGIFSAETTAALFNAFKEKGVDIVTAPSVTTSSGRQAQVQVLETRTFASGETQVTGPVIDVIPHVTADGNSVEVSFIVNFTKPASP